MGLLHKTKTYLIGPMENCDGTPWRDEATTRLKKIGVTVLNPYEKPWMLGTPEDAEARKKLKVWLENGDYDSLSEHMKKVRAEDLRCCDVSDFLIVYLNPNVPTYGTMEEIVTGVREKKPIFVIVEGGKKKTGLWIFGMIPHKYIYNNLEEALIMIENIDAEKVKIDSQRWRLLKPEYR